MNKYPYLRLHLLATRQHSSTRRAAKPDSALAELTASRLRRVFGKALVDQFCSFGTPRCQEKEPGAPRAAAGERCRLAESCPYGVLFARSRSQRVPFALFVTATEPGRMMVELTLFGPAWEHYPWALRALERALEELGIGKQREIWRIAGVARATEESGSSPGTDDVVAGPGLSGLSSMLEPSLLCLDGFDLHRRSSGLRLEMLSPTRWVRRGKVLPQGDEVDFSLVLARILDRFEDLYGGGGRVFSLENRQKLEEVASSVPLVGERTRWVRTQDYSARMRRELDLGGLVGHLHFGGEAGMFLPHLKLGEILHVGKNTASGCGRIRVAA